MQITDKDLQQFRERAKTELQSNGAVGRLAWDAVVNALCNEVEELRKNAAPGNAAKTRKALSDACYAMHNFLKTQNGGYEEMAIALDKAKAALAAPPKPPSNAAVSREALASLLRWVDDHCQIGAFDEGSTKEDIRREWDALNAAKDSVRAALAAPARNCDLYATAEDAYAAWQASPQLTPICDWLFDAAKGGAE